MLDPVVDCFKQEFDRFHGFIEQQIETCPDAVWVEVLGDTPYWLHMLHVLAFIEHVARPYGAPLKQTAFSGDVVRLKAKPDHVMSKADMLALAADMKAVAYAYFETQSIKTLIDKNAVLSETFGRDCTNLTALILLVRHYNYHLGCCAAQLRMHGLPGVY